MDAWRFLFVRISEARQLLDNRLCSHKRDCHTVDVTNNDMSMERSAMRMSYAYTLLENLLYNLSV